MAKKTKRKPNAIQPTARLIAEHHALRKQIASTSDPFLKARLLRQSSSLDTYQAASIQGAEAGGGESSMWLIKAIMRSTLKNQMPAMLKLLDVGAIAGTAYAQETDWIDATYCDLNPQADHVLKADFMDLHLPSAENLYDIVCLSLVLNYEGNLDKRGDMLIHVHNFLKPGGLLYIVLPLQTLVNSRYFNHDRFKGLLQSVGFEKIVQQHDSAKLSYWLLQRVDENAGWDGKKWPKKEIRRGKRYNNFTICVK